MAIDEQNFSIEGVKNKLRLGRDALTLLNAQDNNINILNSIQTIKGKINFLKKLEEDVLKLFPSPNGRADVTQKIIDYNEANFNNFFGLNLKNIFIRDFLAAAKFEKKGVLNEQNKLAEFILQQIVTELQIQGKNISKIGGQELAKLFNFKLTGIISDNGTRLSSTRSLETIGKDVSGVPYIIVENLTPAMRKRLDLILNSIQGKNKGNISFPNLQNVNLQNFNTTKNTINIRLQSQWYSATQGMTESEIIKRIDEDPQVWGPFRDKANKQVISFITQQVSGDARKYTENYLIGRIEKDPNLFFIGKNEKLITGILGEISTVLAIQKLTGKKVPVEWVANNINDESKRKVSIDVVLREQLGINVKNTTDDFSLNTGFHNVRFVDRSPDKIFEKLIGGHKAQNLGEAFETSFFNTSYEIFFDRPHVRKGSNPHFDDTEKGLLKFRENLTTYLYQFAPELLFMATDDLDKQLLILDRELDNKIRGGGNILYMVGGVPFFPSQMLSDLIQDLEGLERDLLQGNKIRKSFFLDIGTSNSTTIVDVLNSRAEQGYSVALGDTPEKKITIQMTTSWLF